MSRPDPVEDKDAFVPPYLRRGSGRGQVDPSTAATGQARSPALPEVARASHENAALPDLVLPEPIATAVVEPAAREGWRWTPVIVGLAVIAWLVALSLLAMGPTTLEARVSSPRLTFITAWVIAATITFLPLEFRLGLPGLTWQGVAGWTLLGYTLAFVPPPRGWLLDLPDLPTYLIFFLALLYAVASAALPLTSLLGRWLYSRRMHQLDMRRARRQANELGMLAVALLALAALRVLSPLTGLLLLAVFILVETLFLSQVAPDG